MADRLIYVIDNIIDEALKGYSTKDMKFYGLCRHEMKGKERRPVSYKGYGDFTPAGFNDNQAISVYHRLTDYVELNDINQGFGKDSLHKETYTINMVVFGTQQKVNSTTVDINYRVAQELKKLVPTLFTSTQLSNLDCVSGSIRATNVQIDKQQVFSTELPDNEYKIKPNYILFSITYQVDLSFYNSCFNYSCPVTPPVSSNACSVVSIYDITGTLITTVEAGGSYTVPCGLLAENNNQLYAD